MAEILDGRALAKTIRQKVKQRLALKPTPPGLAVILVGDDPASHTYVNIKQKACEEVGIRFEKFEYPADISERQLLQKIHKLNQDPSVQGVLVQLPLPTQNADTIIEAIDFRKDVDGFHPTSLQRLKDGKPAIASAVALGVMKLIDETKQDVSNMSACIVSSPLFAEPLKLLLQERGIEAVVTQEEADDLQKITSASDIVIVAEGHPSLITKEHVKKGAILIDVGTTKVDGVLKGDIDFDGVSDIAGYITPVPGGVGPMTVAMLLVNVMKATQLGKL